MMPSCSRIWCDKLKSVSISSYFVLLLVKNFSIASFNLDIPTYWIVLRLLFRQSVY